MPSPSRTYCPHQVCEVTVHHAMFWVEGFLYFGDSFRIADGVWIIVAYELSHLPFFFMFCVHGVKGVQAFAKSNKDRFCYRV